MSGVPGALTAELRWWWQGEAPATVGDWFGHLEAGQLEDRCDLYCATGEPGWGLKRRGEDGPVESKVALALLFPLPAGMPDARLWLKQEVAWPLSATAPVRRVRKRRQVWTLPDARREPRCTIELASVRADDGPLWSSLCFEAAAHLSEPLHNLSLAWRDGRGLPEGLDSGWPASYPEWLMRIAKEEMS